MIFISTDVINDADGNNFKMGNIIHYTIPDTLLG